MSALSYLIRMHRVTVAIMDSVPDDDWDDVADRITAPMETSRQQIVEYRPTTLDEVRKKVEFMLECRSFTAWGDLKLVDVIAGFLPEVEQ